VPDRFGCRVEDAHAIQVRLTHPPAAPQIAVDIDAEAVRRTGAGVDEHLAGAECVGVDVEHAEFSRWHATRFDDVEFAFIG
jgi:hypothetical protein